MLKKAIVSIVVVVAIIGIAFAAYSNTNTSKIVNNTTTNTSNNSSSPVTPVKTVTNTSNDKTTTNVQTNISPAQAQNIADSYILVSNATAGTPDLVNQSGTLVYIVPVVSSGLNVGEIDIDAQTGKNLGGAGGAP